jgi:hypothetical protein
LDVGRQARQPPRRDKLHESWGLVYATALRHGAVLWTQDGQFDGLPGVKFFAKL